MKKIMIGFISMCLFGCASTHNEILINAAPEDVWNVLVDSNAYSQWNPVIIDPKGKFEEGQKVVFQFRESDGKQYEVKAKVIKVVPQKLLNQHGGIWGILTYNHRYILEEGGEGTKVTIHEDYKGVYVPFWNHSNMDASYAKLNEALKNRVMELKTSKLN